MQKIELLPKGGFVINAPNATIRGRFSLYAIELFCEQNGIENYLNLLDKIAGSMRLGQYASLIQCAINDYDRATPQYTRTQVMDLIDEVFDSVNDADFVQLINHVVGRIASIPDSNTPGEETEAEKKSGSSEN